MSQVPNTTPSDANYDVANSTGANVRGDLNNILDAILTMNSGDSSPAYAKAYTLWADTNSSPSVLKIRNAANNNWIELFQLDGTLTLEDGTNSAPGLAFRDDLDTGVYSSAANTFNVATGGTERMELGTTTIFNEDGADVDFRIEGDTDANLFYLDAGNNRIGIGTATPTPNKFHVVHSDYQVALFENTNADANGSYIEMYANSSSPADNDVTGLLAFRGNNSAAENTLYASIRSLATDVTDGTEDGAITFQTRVNGAMDERVRIDSSKIGIGESAPSKTVVISENDGECVAVIKSSDTGTAGLYLGGQTDEIKGGILFNNDTNVLTLQGNNNATRAEIDTSGNFKISAGNLVIGVAGKGIDFSNNTGSASGATSDLLDDYEEGTFAPFFTGSTTSGSYTYSSRNGVYTKVGRVCHFHFDLIVSGISGAGTGNLVINNLPFTSVSSPHSGAAVAYYAHWNSVVPSQLLINISSTNILVYKNSQTSTVLNAAPADILTNTRVIAFGSYVVA